MTDLLFYGQFVASKTGATGLTVTVDIDKFEKATGTRTVVVTAGSATEARRGLYYYRLANATPLTHDYTAVFITADSNVDQQEVAAARIDFTEASAAALAYLDAAVSDAVAAPASALTAYDAATATDVAGVPVAILDDEEASTGVTIRQAIAASGSAADPLLNAVPGSYASGTAGYILGAINPAQVTITSPVATNGTSITVVRGDDYLNTDNRAFTFTGTNWPTLTGGSVALIVDDGAPTSYTGVITGAQACYVEMTDTQTTGMEPDAYTYDLQATLSNGSIVTLVQGTLLVQADVR